MIDTTAEHYTYIDTCCSSSMFLINDQQVFDESTPSDRVIRGSKKGTVINVTATGRVNDWKGIEYSEDINRFLCSGKRLNDMGYEFIVWNGIRIVDHNTGLTVLEGPMLNGMTAVPTQTLLSLPDVSSCSRVCVGTAVIPLSMMGPSNTVTPVL